MKKVFYVFAVILLFINSCCKVKHYIIPEKDKFKMSLGDTLIYKNKSEIIDTMIINYKDDVIVPDNTNFTDGDCSDNDWHEEITYQYSSIKNNYKTNFLKIGQRILNKKNEFFVNSIKNSTTHKSMFINDINYENVIEFNLNNDIIKVYLNITYGVLAYQYNTGEIFYLEK